jgi:hypothetical protein
MNCPLAPTSGLLAAILLAVNVPGALRLAAIGTGAAAERRPPLDRRAAIHRTFRHYYCRRGGACDIDLRAERFEPALRSLGAAQGFPALPDFEYVVRRNAKASMAADRLRDVIIDYFRLAAALRRTSDDANTQTAERGRARSASGS